MMEKPISPEQLKAFYIERLKAAGVYSKADLDKALESGGVDLRIDPEEFIPEDKRNEIENNNPDSIEIGGKSYEVEYKHDSYKNEFSARIKISPEDVLKLEENPKLPSGRELTMDVIAPGSSYAKFSGTDLEDIKEKSKQYLINEQWSRFRPGKEDTGFESIEKFDVFGEIPELPKPIPYGEDPITGDKLYAYPFFKIDWSGTLTVSYYPTEEQAKSAQEEFLKSIEDKKEAKIKESEKDAVKEEAEAMLKKLEIKYEEIKDSLPWQEENNLSRKFDNAKYYLSSDPHQSREFLKEASDEILKYKNILENREKLLPEIQEIGDRIQPKAKEIMDHYERYGLSYDEISEISLKWREIKDAMKNNLGDLEEAMIKLIDLEERVNNIDTQGWESEVAQKYLELAESKRGGVYAKVRIENGEVSNLDGEKLNSVVIGGSGRSYLIDRDNKTGQAIFRFIYGSGRTDDQYFGLSDGSYSIFRDGSYIFKVEFNEDGKITKVIEETEREFKYDGEEEPYGGRDNYEEPKKEEPVSMSGSGLGTMADALNKINLGKGGKEPVPKKEIKTEKPKVETRTKNEEKEEEMTEEIKKELLQEINYLKSILNSTELLGNKPKEQKSDKDKALAGIIDDSKKLLSNLTGLNREVQEEGARPISLRGKISAQENSIKALFKKHAYKILGEAYDNNWIDKYKNNWNIIDNKISESEDAQEFIKGELATREEIVEKTRGILAAKISGIWKGEEVNLDEIIEEALGEF